MSRSDRKEERRLVMQARLEGYLVALLGLLLPDPMALIAQMLVVASAAVTFFDRCALVNDAIRKFRRAMR
jgi:hypothetical protein